MAVQFQHCIIAILDATIPMSNEVRVNIFNELADSLEGMAAQVRVHLPNLPERHLATEEDRLWESKFQIRFQPKNGHQTNRTI